MRLRISTSLSAMAAMLMCTALSGCTTKTFFTSGSTDIQEIVSENSGVQTSKERRFLGLFTPYRIDIQQGNFVSREMVAQLKEKMKTPEGMTQEQVLFVMGTPLVDDMFHKDRWDYAFRLKKSNGDILTSHVSVFFKDGRLVGLEGGDLPTENDYLSLIAGKTPPAPSASDSTKK